MNWVAVVPLKQGASQKSRLSERLDSAQRAALTEVLLSRVLNALNHCRAVSHIILLSPSDPQHPETEWVRDEGRGLNEELTLLRARFLNSNFLIVHADLPFLETDEVAALLGAADFAGVAIAPDKVGLGTNAVALRKACSISFNFGVGSFAKHLAAAPSAKVVQSQGLSHDIDTPDDLSVALELGLRL